MGWVTGTVGDENTVKMVGNLMNGVVIREDGNVGSTGDKRTKNILLDTTVNHSNVGVGISASTDMEWSLGRDLVDEVDSSRVNKASSSSASYSSPTVIRAREEPRSRRKVTRDLVSTPVIAATPSRWHQSASDSTAVQCEYLIATSATTIPIH